jgi:hypothetical protein
MSNVKQIRKDIMIKTKQLLTGVALTGTLLASATAARANAYMELISGGSTVTLSTAGAVSGSGSYSILYGSETGNSGVLLATVGGWTMDVAIGNSSGALNIVLSDQVTSIGATAGLEIIYSSGAYALNGKYSFGASDSGANSLPLTVNGYEKTGSQYVGSGSMGTALNPTPDNLPITVPASITTGPISLDGSYYITEVLNFGPPVGGTRSTSYSLNGSASFSDYVAPPPAPDGGMTVAMFGAVLTGFVGLRSKFAAKAS